MSFWQTLLLGFYSFRWISDAIFVITSVLFHITNGTQHNSDTLLHLTEFQPLANPCPHPQLASTASPPVWSERT